MRSAQRADASQVDPSWQTMKVAHRYAALIRALDADAAFEESLLPDVEAHSTPLLCMGSDGEEEVAQSSQLYQDTARQLLNKLRLFSFTKGRAA